MKRNLDWRVWRVEKTTSQLIGYREFGMLTCNMLAAMQAARAKNLDDLSLMGEVLDEMTEHAERMLRPLGFGVVWGKL